MRIRTLSAVLLAVVLPISSCSESGITDPRSPSPLTLDVVPAAPKMVISQIFGGGGSSGAVPQNDYVELFNAGNAAATLTGWSLQYASATGTGGFGTNGQIAALAGSVEPGQYYLVKFGPNSSTGTPLPAHQASTTFNMAVAAGKLALVDQAAALGCNTATNCTTAQKARIIDLVGYGNATWFEGAGAAPTLSNTTAAFR